MRIKPGQKSWLKDPSKAGQHPFVSLDRLIQAALGTLQSGKRSEASAVPELFGGFGKVLARFIHSPGKPGLFAPDMVNVKAHPGNRFRPALP